MTDTAKRLIKAILEFKSIFTFPDHGGDNVTLEDIIKNFDFVETGYIQDKGQAASIGEYFITMVENAIRSRNGSVLIDIIKEAGKNRDLPPAYVTKHFVGLFGDSGLQLFESEGKLFDVPGAYQTGMGYPDDEAAVNKAVECIKDILGHHYTPPTLKRKAKILYNIFYVYAHLQTRVLLTTLGQEWVDKAEGKDFFAFKEAIDNTIKGIAVNKPETKYAQPETPYIYFQGTDHLNGSSSVHSAEDPIEEIEHLKAIMIDTSIKRKEAFTKAITFIHRSIFQKEIYSFLGTPFDSTSHYWRLDPRERGDQAFAMVERYMEQHRKPYPPEAEAKPTTSRYALPTREVQQPTQLKEEQAMTNNTQEMIKLLSHGRSLEDIVSFLKSADPEIIKQIQEVCGDEVSVQSILIHSMMERYFGKGDPVAGLKARLEEASKPNAPKIEFSGPEGGMMAQLKEIFGDDAVFIPLSKSDNIGDILQTAFRENTPAVTQEVTIQLNQGLDNLTKQWAECLGITDVEVIKHLRTAAAKKIDLEKYKASPNTTEIRHTRGMEFEVLDINNEVESRYRGIWDCSTKVLAVSVNHTGRTPGVYQYLFHARFMDYSDAVSTFTGIRDNYGIKSAIEIARDHINAYNGQFIQ